MQNQTILLESGTDEAEFLEFHLDDQSVAINATKVKSVQEFEQSKLTGLPHAPLEIGSKTASAVDPSGSADLHVKGVSA